MKNERELCNSLEEEYGFLTPKFYSDPYPFYAALQKAEPVHWSDRTKSWLVTSHDLVLSGLSSPSFTSKRLNYFTESLSDEESKSIESLSDFYNQWLMYMEGPDHNRLKHMMHRPLSPTVIGQDSLILSGQVAQILDKIKEKRSMDLLKDFATPLGLYAVGNILNIPEEDHPLIIKWSHDLVGFLGSDKDTEKAHAAQNTLSDLMDFLDPIISQKPENIKSNLLQVLVSAQLNGSLSKEELLGVVANILIDGHEPIANLVTNGSLALMQNPDQWQILIENPGLAGDSAVEEIIRFDPPFQFSSRRVVRQTKLDDKVLSTGEKVQFMLGAANRDPNVFNDPQTLDVKRIINPHAAFGYGAHYCPGASLGRLAVKVGFESLASELPQLHLKQYNLKWVESLGYRSLTSLEVEW